MPRQRTRCDQRHKQERARGFWAGAGACRVPLPCASILQEGGPAPWSPWCFPGRYQNSGGTERGEAVSDQQGRDGSPSKGGRCCWRTGGSEKGKGVLLKAEGGLRGTPRLATRWLPLRVSWMHPLIPTDCRALAYAHLPSGPSLSHRRRLPWGRWVAPG